MTYAILTTSRGNPMGLAATVMGVRALAKRREDLVFCIRADDDDAPTLDAITSLRATGAKIETIIGQGRPDSLGGEINRLADLVPDADAYLVMNDSVYPIPYIQDPAKGIVIAYWDVLLRDAILKCGDDKVFCWHMPMSKSYDYPIVTRRWRRAAGGIFTDLFPFWGDDRYLAAIHMMVHTRTPVIIKQMMIHAPKTTTQRMRDVLFWDDFYRSLETERISRAYELRAKFGIKGPIDPDLVGLLRETEAKFRAELGDKERLLGDKSEPGTAYARAKTRAEAIMRQGVA